MKLITKIGAVVVAAAIASTSACNKPLPPNTPVDVTNALDCVVSALLTGNPAAIAGCIVTYGPALVADALQMLLASPQFAVEHPEAIPLAKAQLQIAQQKLLESKGK
jgi:hypothetical protein